MIEDESLQLNDRWEVALTVSDKGFQQVSFVNSIATSKVRGNNDDGDRIMEWL